VDNKKDVANAGSQEVPSVCQHFKGLGSIPWVAQRKVLKGGGKNTQKFRVCCPNHTLYFCCPFNLILKVLTDHSNWEARIRLVRSVMPDCSLGYFFSSHLHVLHHKISKNSSDAA
jgi:hypothetical protein